MRQELLRIDRIANQVSICWLHEYDCRYSIWLDCRIGSAISESNKRRNCSIGSWKSESCLTKKQPSSSIKDEGKKDVWRSASAKQAYIIIYIIPQDKKILRNYWNSELYKYNKSCCYPFKRAMTTLFLPPYFLFLIRRHHLVVYQRSTGLPFKKSLILIITLVNYP